MTERETETGGPSEQEQQQQQEAIFAMFRHVEHILDREFEEYEVQGQIGGHPVYGPMFAYTLSSGEKVYSCGFFATEIIPRLQEGGHLDEWLASFFVEMMRNGENRPLPDPPQTEDDTKALFDGRIVPHCAQSVRAEFADEQVYVDLEFYPEHGPVLETGFPSIKEGANTCAMPLQFLMALHMLNRDPADPIIQALYRLKDEHPEPQDIGKR